MTVLDGRYALGAELGRGGLGIVLEAVDRDLSRPVAVKLLKPQADASPDHLTRMLREANAMARISHPNVVEVFDVRRYCGLHDDRPPQGVPKQGVAIVMELVQGQDLCQWLEQPRSEAEIVAKFLAAGRGLAAAHAQGIVHRDFKPANVLIGDDGRVKVTDFGLAAACDPREVDTPANDGRPPDAGTADSDAPRNDAPRNDAWLLTSKLTRTGIAMGTPAYMAPEQHRGHAVDPRTDQYALCLALAEALYGERPVAGTTMAELLDSKLRVQLPTGRKLKAGLRPALQRGLSASPEARFESMDALLHALRRPRHQRPKLAVAAAVGAGTAAWLALGSLTASDASDPRVHTAAATQVSPTDIRVADSKRGAGWTSNRVALADRPHRGTNDASSERRAIFTEMRALRQFEDPDSPPEPRLDRVVALLARAKALGDLALQADLLLSRASLEVAHGNRDAGAQSAEQGFTIAVETGSHVLASRAAALLFAYNEDDSEQGERWRRMAEMHIKLAGGEPRAEKYLEDMLARIAARAGDFDEALIHGERLVTLCAEVEGEEHPRVGYALKWNSMYHAELGNLAEAESTLAKGIEILRLTFPDTHAAVLRGRGRLATVLLDRKRTTEALVELKHALADLAKREAARGSDWVSESVLWDAGAMMQDLDRHQDALTYFRRIVPLLPDKPDYWNGFSLHRKIADSLLELGRKDEAVQSLNASLKYVSTDSAEWDQRAQTRELLARLERELAAPANSR